MAGKSFAGPYHVSSICGAKDSACAGGMFQTGGGNRMRSAWQATATVNATLGDRCSIQQFRKYGSPRNFFGGTGPRSKAKTLERNSSRRPVHEIASAGEYSFPPRPGLEGSSPPRCMLPVMRRWIIPRELYLSGPSFRPLLRRNGLPLAARFATIGLPFKRPAESAMVRTPGDASLYGDNKIFF